MKKIIRCWESIQICGSLSNIVNARNELPNIDECARCWHEIQCGELFQDSDCLYAVESATSIAEVDDIDDIKTQGYKLPYEDEEDN